MYADISMDDKFQIESGYDPHDKVPARHGWQGPQGLGLA